jgi:hypothetical protein
METRGSAISQTHGEKRQTYKKHTVVYQGAITITDKRKEKERDNAYGESPLVSAQSKLCQILDARIVHPVLDW